jgi:hypothetical protein
LDCGIKADLTVEEISAERIFCGEPDFSRETAKVFGEYPLAGDFEKTGYDLVVDGDLEVNQRVHVPDTRQWRACRDVEINEGGQLIIDGTLTIGEE